MKKFQPYLITAVIVLIVLAAVERVPQLRKVIKGA